MAIVIESALPVGLINREDIIEEVIGDISFLLAL